MFFILYTKKRGFWQFLAILAIKMADFLKLELFLRPSLKTRSHDGSAHTFGFSQRFLEVPQKRVLKKLNLNILNMAWWSIGTNNVL